MQKTKTTLLLLKAFSVENAGAAAAPAAPKEANISPKEETKS